MKQVQDATESEEEVKTCLHEGWNGCFRVASTMKGKVLVVIAVVAVLLVVAAVCFNNSRRKHLES